jgi:polysaccharide chain length determinant protein (PEP-CTERM system associated)
MIPTTPESYGSVARRPLDIEDYIDIVRRHKAWILGPTFAALVIAVVVAFLWPDTYISSATIRVVPPQVPQSLVPSNVVTEMSQRINAMYQTISSRGNLANLINSNNLYPRERQRKPMEDVVEDMRKHIKLGNVVPITQGDRTIPAFQISFAYENRLLAQKVTADLVGRFISENTRERTTQSVMTTAFLKDQVESAKKELDGLEERLASFRTNFQGRLPEQYTANQMQMNVLEQRIGNLNGMLARISQEKMLLESDLRTVKTQRASLTPAPEQIAQRQKNQEVASWDRQILQLEANLAILREQYKDTYPDVRRVMTQLSTAKKMRERLAAEDEAERTKEAAAGAKPNARMDPLMEREARSLDAASERIEAQIKAKNLEAESIQKEIEATQRHARSIQSRIESAPVSEQHYSELIRDRELAKLKYEDLNKKRTTSAIAEELERRQQGETLELLDPASLPQTPTEPNRPMIVGAGVAAGVIVGLFLAGAREAKDTSLKNLKDVRAYTQLPILGSVPLLENALVVRRRKRLTWLAWSTACLVGIMIMTGSVFYYYATKV